MNITTLGEPRFDTPLRRTVRDDLRVPVTLVRDPAAPPAADDGFELAGPRAKLFFDPARVRAGIVTCGGLCPGINNVIRSLFLELHHAYGVPEILGFRDGYRGLEPARGRPPLRLTAEHVDKIHPEGGTMLGTSRGPGDTALAVDHLIALGVNMLFTIGGDGTQRGGRDLFQEARRRGHPLAVVGIPKTVDNDVAFVTRTFGYLTAVEQAAHMLTCAHTEAHSVRNGVSIVKLMGRDAGFITVGATLASQDVNFCLIPEVPFRLEGPGGLLAALKRRVRDRNHALIAVAEGAGQELLAGSSGKDASGNAKLADIGPFLRERIEAFFKAEQIESTVRYIDPSYLVRSVPADAEDAILCDQFARHAAHAAMAGKTGLVIGQLHDEFVHVPIELLATQRKRVDPESPIWRSVLSATGQPARFE